jgi:hypothetical protein
MNGNSKVGFPRWITAEGTVDLAKLSIDGILKQAIDPEFERFRSACVLLRSMANAGRQEAGLYLIGLLAYYASDLQRLEVIAGQLGHFSHESSANALLTEIRRVRSSNTTRQYLSRVLQSLSVLPLHLVKSGLEVLAEDTSFSSKMRAKFRNCCERIRI